MPGDFGQQMRLATLLSVLAGMVDLTGFLGLGNLFTAHITGNLVIIATLVVRRGTLNAAQILAIPFFVVAVAATWLLARISGKSGPGLTRLLLYVQFGLLGAVSVLGIAAHPSAHPHGLMATIAAMIAVSAMGCQFALLRLALSGAPTTAVMTGNLTNAVLALLDSSSRPRPVSPAAAKPLKDSLHVLVGFVGGCVVAAVAVSLVGDFAWLLPAAVAALAPALR